MDDHLPALDGASARVVLCAFGVFTGTGSPRLAARFRR
jgi:hypothetical protein